MLHLDATYKLSLTKFEGFLFGYTDRDAKFHLLALFLSSKKNSDALSKMFDSIEELWWKYFNEAFPFTHIMSDADTALACYWSQSYAERELLMCYRHVQEAVSRL